MTIEVPSGNTTLLQSQVASILVEPLAEQSSFLSAGPIILDSASPVRVPRIASTITAAFYAPGVQITDQSIDFDEVELLPSSLKALKTLTRVSSELIRQSVIGLEATLQTRLVSDVSRTLDAALWNGAGTSDSILGILQAENIVEGDLSLNPDWVSDEEPAPLDTLADALATAQGNHVMPSHWAMRADTFNVFRKLKVNADLDSRYLFGPDNAAAGVAPTIYNLPVIITSHVPADSVALVDFSKVVVVRDIDAEVKILDQTWGDYDSTGIRVATRYDVALLQDEAVTLLTVPSE